MFDLTNCRFAFLDLETTGLSPWFGDRICEIGIVLTEGKRIRETFESLVNPGRELSLAAASTNGLTDAELASAPPFEALAEAVIAHLRDAVVVCHNAQFDLQFLDSEFRRAGREVQIPNLIDTLILAREHFDLPSNTLHALAETFGVPMDVSHRALADALTDRGVFFGMLDALKPPGGRLDDFIGIYSSPAWPQDGVKLPTELSEAIHSGRRLRISYVDGKGNRSKRWVTPYRVIGLSDYLYLNGHCHMRNAERSFRLDRIVELAVEV
jgi:DNA polymerase III epsilon subunit